MKDEVICPKCQSKMEKGISIDRGESNSKMRNVWIEGEAETSFWQGIKTSGKNIYQTIAFRCPDCSYLEFYTTEKVYI